MLKLVKVCGIQRAEDAQVAVDAGADFVGVIMVPNRKRTIALDEAKKISALVKSKRRGKPLGTIQEIIKTIDESHFETFEDYSDRVSQLISENGPFLVCVFRNQPMKEVFELATDVGADIIQLHGKENKLEYCRANKQLFDASFGIIPRYVIPDEVNDIYDGLEHVLIGGKYFGNGFLLPLLDSELGGEGKRLDWNLIHDLDKGRFILAGGLTDENVEELTGFDNVVGFDVSGGVETNGVKNAVLIRSFVKASKSVT